MTHQCGAAQCDVQIRREFLMCPRHWRKVPRDLQALVSKYWREGPTSAWRIAASRAHDAVGIAEGVYEPVGELVGVVRNVAFNQLECDIPVMLDQFGWPDTPERRDELTGIVARAVQEAFPGIPTTVIERKKP